MKLSSPFFPIFTAVALALSALSTPAQAATGQYVAYSLHTDAACTSVPKQIAYTFPGASSSDCPSNSCLTDGSTGLFLDKTCVTDPSAHSMARFGVKPYLQFEIYAPTTACTSLASVIAYLADGSCLTVDSGSSSVRAYSFANASAAIVRYDGASCSGSPTKSNTLAKEQLGKATCLEGLLLASTGNATTEPESAMGASHAPSTQATASWMMATLLAVATTAILLW